MKNISFAAAIAALCGSLAFAADKAPSISDICSGQLKMVEGEFVSLAEAMPADKYDFAPTGGEFKGVRTFAQQVKHVAAVNYLVAAQVLGEKPPVDIGKGENGPDSITSKDDIVKFLKGSFEYAHKAADTVTSANATEMLNSPFGEGKSPRLGLVSVPVWHPFDHYGQMVVYARMNGIVPPASRK